MLGGKLMIMMPANIGVESSPPSCATSYYSGNYNNNNFETSSPTFLGQQITTAQQAQNCLACEFPISHNGTLTGRQKLCQACRKFFYRHSMKTHERLEMAPCMCKFKASPPVSNQSGDTPPFEMMADGDNNMAQQSSNTSARSHSICKSCRYRRCLQAGLADDTSNNNKSPNNDPSINLSGQNSEHFDIKQEESGDDYDEAFSSSNNNIKMNIDNYDSYSSNNGNSNKIGNNSISEDGATTAPNLDVSQLPCSVCGWSATGVHFGAVTCDACKAFYGRFARRLSGSSNNNNGRTSVVSLTGTNSCCLTGGKCFDNGTSLHVSRVSQNRMRCASCRISKCIAVGMSPFGSVAGRRSQAQKKAITEAVKEFFRTSSTSTSPGSSISPSLTTVQSPSGISISPSSQMMASDANMLLSHSTAQLSPINQQYIHHNVMVNPLPSVSSNSPITMSPGGHYGEQKAIAQSPSSIFNKYSELIDTIRNKRASDDGGKSVGSQLMWLYNSGSGVIDLKQLEMGGFKELPLEMDPQRFFERFLANPPSPLPYSRQLTLDQASRAEWLISKVVNATKILAKISEVRCYVNDSMGPLEIWRSVMDNFVINFKFALQFVRNLPGFDWVQNVTDRILLFSNALFPILVLQLSIDYDPLTDTPYVFNIDKECCHIARQKMILVAKAEPAIRESGISLKNARINVAEFGLIGGLLFFNDQVNGLNEPSKVKLIADDYLRAVEMLAHQSSPDARRRLEVITQQVRHFGNYSQMILRLMGVCKVIYPDAIGIEPLMEEVMDQMARIHISTPSSETSSEASAIIREFPADMMKSPITCYQTNDFVMNNN